MNRAIGKKKEGRQFKMDLLFISVMIKLNPVAKMNIMQKFWLVEERGIIKKYLESSRRRFEIFLIQTITDQNC